MDFGVLGMLGALGVRIPEQGQTQQYLVLGCVHSTSRGSACPRCLAAAALGACTEQSSGDRNWWRVLALSWSGTGVAPGPVHGGTHSLGVPRSQKPPAKAAQGLLPGQFNSSVGCSLQVSQFLSQGCFPLGFESLVSLQGASESQSWICPCWSSSVHPQFGKLLFPRSLGSWEMLWAAAPGTQRHPGNGRGAGVWGYRHVPSSS